MKIPLEWLHQYIKTNNPAKELAASFTSLGLLLDKPIYPYEASVYKTEVLDLEHRMDRADWLSILGCARDLCAFENATLIQPELYTKKGASLHGTDRVKIEVECPDLVHRFNTRVFKGIKVNKSPDWLRHRLEAYGIPSINNIVDITNYVMVELGQPMHAQDLTKMEKREIVIRRAKNGEKLTTLLGETINLDDQCFVLTQNDKPTVLGGIVGGVSTKIEENTTDIVLDAGNYNQTNIRKTSRRLKIQNETVLRYDKFLHPELAQIAIQRATKLILDIAGGNYYENEDWYPKKAELKQMRVRYSRIKAISGLELEDAFIKNVLTKLEYKILRNDKEALTLEVPYFRTDVEVEDDIISDLLRMYGYHKIPTQVVTTAPPKNITPKILKFEDALRDVCTKLGLHEHITEPLVEFDPNDATQIKLQNAQSKVKDGLRPKLHASLVAIAENYTKHGFTKVGLFEVGKSYTKLAGSVSELSTYVETHCTQVYFNDSKVNPTENSIEVRKLLDGLMKGMGITKYNLVKTAQTSADIYVEDKVIGSIGHDQITLLNQSLLPSWQMPTNIITEFQPKMVDDISILINKETELGMVEKAVSKSEAGIISVEIFPQTFTSSTENMRNVIIRVTHKLQDFQPLRSKIAEVLKQDFNAVLK